MEKEPIKLRLSTVISIILIIILLISVGLLIAYSHNEKQADLNKINSLETNLAQLQHQFDQLQSNTANTANTSNTSNTSNNNTITNSTTISPKLGNYTIEHPTTENETGISNEECGITLQDNNQFSIYMGFGAYLKGTYSIKNNQIIAKATQRTDELAETKTVEVDFTFDILSQNRLELTNISGKNANTDKVLFREGIKINMTYTIK